MVVLVVQALLRLRGVIPTARSHLMSFLLENHRLVMPPEKRFQTPYFISSHAHACKTMKKMNQRTLRFYIL